MTDKIISVSLENLIGMAIGCYNEENNVNYKLVQTILHILARQMRLLGQKVEIRMSDVESEDDNVTHQTAGKKDKDHKQKQETKERDKSVERGEKAIKEKAQVKEKTKIEKEAQIEEKGSSKEKEKSKSGKKAKEGRKDAESKGRSDSGSSILISEADRKNEKVIVVEKGPTTRTDASRTRVGSIEVVTLSQFELLEDAVKELKQKTGPIPSVSLPDNEKLRADIARGSATLIDTMQAMQVSARVNAAEQAIGRMSELLTQLAATGALPQELIPNVAEISYTPPVGKEDTVATPSRPTTPSSGQKSVAIDPKAGGGAQKSVVMANTVQHSVGTLSRPSIMSRASTSTMPLVTHSEMGDAIKSMKTEMMKNINNQTSRAMTAADTAFNAAKSVADKLDVAVNLDKRISTLYSLVSDYAEQLSGFDAGLVSSMQGFQDQMMQMRHDLKNALGVMSQANNNGETEAVKELTERCDGLGMDLEQTIHAHHDLIALQGQLGNELKSLVECVEMLREQKSDRDEVLDGLRDKADMSRLSGLLHEEKFAIARDRLEATLRKCHIKFQRQDAVWMTALKELSSISEGKATILDLMGQKENVQQQLRELDEKLYQLAVELGEPKAALLTRALSRGARCCACGEPALMEPHDVSSDGPPRLPALRPSPAPPLPSLPPLPIPCRPPTSAHMCHRWVGGSHTLVSVKGGVGTREQAPRTQLETLPPLVHFTGCGTDGRVYLMEEELQPCAECNKLSTDVEGARETAADGAGDRGPRPSKVLIKL